MNKNTVLFFDKPIPKQTVLSKKWQRQNNLNIYFQADYKQELYLANAGLIGKNDSVLNLQSNKKNYVWLYANDRYVFSIGTGSRTTKKFFSCMCKSLEKIFGRKIDADYESRYTEKFISGDESLEEFCERNEVAYHWNHTCNNYDIIGNAGLQLDCPICGKSRMMTPEQVVSYMCKDGCLRSNEQDDHAQVYTIQEAKIAIKAQGTPF